jgi:flagellar protein FliS
MYAMNNAFRTYKQQGVLTANPLELVVMLYDGGIKQLKIASIAIEEKEYEQVNNALQKAQRIIMELMNSLDLRFPIAKELMMLYEFMMREISSANAAKDTERVGGVIQLLNELKDAWLQLAKSGVGSVAQIGE